MEFTEGIRTRRSVRRFTAEPIPRETLERIVALASFAPSWKNTQVVRYTVVTNRALIETIADECVLGFALNTATFKGCAALAVQSTVAGRSGYERDGSFTTAQGTHWQSFDAGVSAQTFCLAAHACGVGTVITGIFDEKRVAELIGLPANESVSAIIPMGFPAEEPVMPPRKDVSVLLRTIE